LETDERSALLALLDLERQTVLYPGVTRHSDAGVVRDMSEDGKSGEVVYSSSSEGEVGRVIEDQVRAARSAGYDLEWKVYGHDRPLCLGERLRAAGFEAGDKEAFLVFHAGGESLARFGDCSGDVRRVTGEEGLEDYRMIVEEVRGGDRKKEIEREIGRYALTLRDHPDNMSLYVAYADGVPAACGRVYFHRSSRFAGLYGSNTRTRFRKRGLFTQVVAAHIRETVGWGIVYVCVDALPTSEPILRKRGFEAVTHTQPFRLGLPPGL